MNTQEFDHVWNEIKKLQGKTVLTLAQGKKNKILFVGNDYLERSSSNNISSKISKKTFEGVYNILMEKRTLTRKNINSQFPVRGSSIITAVLAQVTTITFIEKPELTLKTK